MERQVTYNWLPEEGRAVAQDQFVEGFFNWRVLTAIAVLFYLPLIAQAYWANPRFFVYPIFYLGMLGPVAIYALEYWRHMRGAMSPERGLGVTGPPVTFVWDEQGLDVSCDGSGLKVDWSKFSQVIETERFIKLYTDQLKPAAYVFKRPMSAAQLADIRSCTSVIGKINPVFA